MVQSIKITLLKEQFFFMHLDYTISYLYNVIIFFWKFNKFKKNIHYIKTSVLRYLNGSKYKILVYSKSNFFMHLDYVRIISYLFNVIIIFLKIQKNKKKLFII